MGPTVVLGDLVWACDWGSVEADSGVLTSVYVRGDGLGVVAKPPAQFRMELLQGQYIMGSRSASG